MNSSKTQSSKPRRSRFWRLWFRALLVKRPQAALALGSLVVGGAVAAMLLNLYGDVRRKMSEEFRAYGPNVVLAPPAGPSAPGGITPVLPERVLEELAPFERRAGGLTSVPLLWVVMRLERQSADPRLPEFSNVVVAGTDFARLRGLYPHWRWEGNAGALERGECFIGSRVAARLRLAVGDTAELRTIGDSPAQTTVRVSGVVATGSSEDDQVFVPLPALQRLAGLDGQISVVEVRVAGEAPEIAAAVAELAGAFPGLEVRPLRQVVESEGKVLETIRALLISLSVLILLIIGLCVTATMTAIVLERRKDIAVMKALGADDGWVMRLFLAESAGLGLVGGVGGFALGFWLARELGQQLFAVNLRPLWWAPLGVCLLTVVVAVMATLVPVRLIRSVQPATALKGE
jgi:putative ABC transport system permease protein